VDGGSVAIARHLTRYAQLLAKPDREHSLDTTLFLHKIRDLVPMADTAPDLILSRFSGAPMHAAMTRQIQLLWVVSLPSEPPTEDLQSPYQTDRDYHDDDFSSNLIRVTIHNLS
jgi:hypothetical protein